MITKQQALEFLYELSQKYEVTINSYLGKLSIKGFNSEDIEFDTPAIDKGLEGAVQELIKHYPFIAEKVTDKIPVDIDMLEVGQTYKVHVQHDWEHRTFTEKFLGFDEEDDYILRFENSKCNKSKPAEVSKYDIREIYKVNE